MKNCSVITVTADLSTLFYRSVERFTSSHDFALENLHVLNKEDSRIKNIKTEVLRTTYLPQNIL